MIVGKIPTAEMIAELKRRLEARAEGDDYSNYGLAAQYLDYVQMLLRGTMRKRTPEEESNYANYDRYCNR